MLAACYERPGPAREVLHLGDLPDPQPKAGEVRVRMRWSGVNPSDVKSRAGSRGPTLPFARIVPHSDGMGVIDAVGAGVPLARIGERVWTWNAAWGRADGTAAQFVCLPAAQAVRLARRRARRGRRLFRHPGAHRAARGAHRRWRGRAAGAGGCRCRRGRALRGAVRPPARRAAGAGHRQHAGQAGAGAGRGRRCGGRLPAARRRRPAARSDPGRGRGPHRGDGHRGQCRARPGGDAAGRDLGRLRQRRARVPAAVLPADRRRSPAALLHRVPAAAGRSSARRGAAPHLPRARRAAAQRGRARAAAGDRARA